MIYITLIFFMCLTRINESYTEIFYNKLEKSFLQIKFAIENNKYDSINVIKILSTHRKLIDRHFGQGNNVLHFLLKHYKYKDYEIFDYIVKFIISNFSNFDIVYNSINKKGKKAIEVSRSNENLCQFFKILKKEICNKKDSYFYIFDYISFHKLRRVRKDIWGKTSSGFIFYTDHNY